MHPAFDFVTPAYGPGTLGDAKSDASDKIYEKLPESTPIVVPGLVGAALGALYGLGIASYTKTSRMYGAGVGAAGGVLFSLYGAWVGAKAERRTISDFAADQLLDAGKAP